MKKKSNQGAGDVLKKINFVLLALFMTMLLLSTSLKPTQSNSQEKQAINFESCNLNGECEADETQAGCPTDCILSCSTNADCGNK